MSLPIVTLLGRMTLALLETIGSVTSFAIDAVRQGVIARPRHLAVFMADTGGAGLDVAMEMSGSYAAYRDAFDLLRMGGTFVLLGIPEGEVKLDFAKDVIFRGISTTASAPRVRSSARARRTVRVGSLCTTEPACAGGAARVELRIRIAEIGTNLRKTEKSIWAPARSRSLSKQQSPQQKRCEG